MLRLSKLTDYGTVVMTHMAREPERVYTAGEITDAVQVAMPTVSKILKLLTREGLLVSYRGAKGGYQLARPPAEISVASVVGALEGAVGLTECASTPGLCEQEPVCSIRGNWQRINRVVLKALDGITLAEMIEPLPRNAVAVTDLQTGGGSRQVV